MKDRTTMPFYWAVEENCPLELSQRIEDLLGDCLPENFVPENKEISITVSKLWEITLNNPIEEIMEMSCYLKAKVLFKQYVQEYSTLINQRRLRTIERLAIIQLLHSCWAFPAIAETRDLDNFLSLCEEYKQEIF